MITLMRRKRSPASVVMPCRRCGTEFMAKNRNVRCARCREMVKNDAKCKTTSTLQTAPMIPNDCPEWLEKADWDSVETTWVALLVEQFHDDAPGTIAVLARSLAIIRKRYRETGAPRKPNAHSP